MNVTSPLTSNLLPGFASFNEYFSDSAIVVKSGEGSYIVDTDGGRHLDAVSGLWNHCFGFKNNDLIEVVARAIGNLPGYHGMIAGSCEATLKLSVALLDVLPDGFDRVFFTNSGSEAVETAVKALWLINTREGRPQKRKIISRYGAYHGVTIFATSMLGKDYVDSFGERDSKVLFTQCPHFSRLKALEISEEDYVTQLINDVAKLIEAEGYRQYRRFHR